MSPSCDRKRKAAAVSDGETDTSPRLTKELKAPPRIPTSVEGANEANEYRPPGLLDLPAGVVGKVAQFLPIFCSQTESTDTSLMALSLVTGRKTSRIIRKEYLRNNLDYLEYLIVAVASLQEELLSASAPGTRSEAWISISTLKAALEQWMEVNEWWKDACRDAALFGQGGEIGTDYPQIFKTVVLDDFASETEKNKFKEEINIGNCGQIDLFYEGSPLGDDYTILLAVDDVVLKGMEPEHADNLLLRVVKGSS